MCVCLFNYNDVTGVGERREGREEDKIGQERKEGRRGEGKHGTCNTNYTTASP